MKPKKRKRMKPGTILAAVLVVCALAVLITLAAGSVFRVRSILVVGNREIPREEIINLSGVQIGDSYFEVSDSTLRKRIETNRYIGFTGRDFDYNGTLTLYITERRGMAVVRQGGVNYVIDESGMILEMTGETYPVDVQGPRVDGLIFTKPIVFVVGQKLPVQDVRQLEALTAVLHALDKTNLLSRSSRLDIKNIKNISVMISDATSIELGDSSELELKLLIAASVLATREPMPESKLNGAKIDVSNGQNAHFIPGTRETPTPVPTATPTAVPAPTPRK